MPEVTLKRQTFSYQRSIPTEVLRREDTYVDPVLFFREEINHMLLELSVHLYGEDITGVIQHPATWWDAVKDHFFPVWLKKAFPVLYSTHNIYSLALYPDISMSDRRPLIHCLTQEQSHTYICV